MFSQTLQPSLPAPVSSPQSVSPLSPIGYQAAAPMQVAQYPQAMYLPSQVVPTPPILVQQSPAYQADSSQSNPWQQAFQGLVGFLSQPIGGRSPNLMPSSPPTIDYNTSVLPQQLSPQHQPQYQQTWGTNQGYYDNYSLQSQQPRTPYGASQSQVRNPGSQAGSNGYPNSPVVSEYWDLGSLNEYACKLEDKIDEGSEYIKVLAQLHNQTSRQIQALKPAMQHYLAVAERHDLMEQLLLDPDLLADWTLKMLGEGGVYGSRQPQSGRPAFPQTYAPSSAAAANNWNYFEQVMSQNPAQAWQVIDRMGAGDFQSRPMFVPT